MGMPEAPKAKWFWYSVICVLCWGAWVLFSKLGSDEIPASAMQFLFAFGFIPVALLVLILKPVKFEKSMKGIACSLGNGVLAGIGGLALFAAYRTGGNTSVITAATALYPLITVVLAILVLRERLTWLQVGGLGFAVVAIIIFSL
jgi:transporter family protein